MARGDVVVFDEALAKLIDGDYASTDQIFVAICDNTAAPAAATVTPTLGDFTEVGAAGTYTAGGTLLGTIADMVSQTAGALKFDSAVNPNWLKDPLNDVDAHWGIIYNNTNLSDEAIAYVDLGGPVDMTAGELVLTWDALGIFSIAKV